jgi:hypothetical protein
MGIVAARVHFSFDLGCKRETASLGDRQRVHVGSERDHSAGGGSFDVTDHAGLRDAPVADLQRIELSLDQSRRLVFLESELRPPMYRPPQLDDALG